MGWRVRRNKDPVPMGDIVVEAGVVERCRSIQRLQNMDLAGVILLCVGEESLVVDCDGVEGLLGGNVAEDSEGGFLGAEAMEAVSHRLPVCKINNREKQKYT